eukprot:557088-Amphidinium_carterae.1
MLSAIKIGAVSVSCIGSIPRWNRMQEKVKKTQLAINGGRRVDWALQELDARAYIPYKTIKTN